MYTEKKDKIAAIFSYLGWAFWIVAFIIRNKDDALSHEHLNQGFVLALAGTLTGLLARFHGLLGFSAGALGLAVAVLSIMGIVRAAKGSHEPLPVVGEIQLI